jgi:hypothetical protein
VCAWVPMVMLLLCPCLMGMRRPNPQSIASQLPT